MKNRNSKQNSSTKVWPQLLVSILIIVTKVTTE